MSGALYLGGVMTGHRLVLTCSLNFQSLCRVTPSKTRLVGWRVDYIVIFLYIYKGYKPFYCLYTPGQEMHVLLSRQMGP